MWVKVNLQVGSLVQDHSKMAQGQHEYIIVPTRTGLPVCSVFATQKKEQHIVASIGETSPSFFPFEQGYSIVDSKD